MRGPWTLEVPGEDGSPVQRRVRIRTAADWASGHAGTPGPACQWTRPFNWTFPDPPPRQVRLVVEGAVPRQIRLNDIDLTPCPAADGCFAEIGQALEDRNRLMLGFAAGDRHPYPRAVKLQVFDAG